MAERALGNEAAADTALAMVCAAFMLSVLACQKHELEPPSTEERVANAEEGWELDGDLEGARHRMFVGHAAGMPTWGVAGISLREIDAVAHYVLDVLRPEVLGTPEG